MGLFYLIVSVMVFVGGLVFSLRTLNRLPRDISNIVESYRDRNKRELYAAIAETLFCLGLSAVFVIFFVIPVGDKIIEGFTGWFEFLSGF